MMIIPEDHVSRFIKKFVKSDFKYLDDENEKSRGRAAYRKTALLSIILYAYYDNHTCHEMEDLTMFHDVYKYLGDGITPSERTFQRFIKENKDTISKVLQKTVNIAQEKGFTKFNHIAIDGTIIKANNSNYNIIKAKD